MWLLGASSAHAAFPGENGKIAFLKFETEIGPGCFPCTYDVYKTDPDGTARTKLTDTLTYEWDPVWSPDGRRLAFSTYRDGNDEIYLMNPDGSGVKRLTNHPREDFVTGWSPDGTRLVFYSNRDGATGALESEYEIYTMEADGSSVRRLTSNSSPDTVGEWSPDGSKIAFTSHRPPFSSCGDKELYLMNPDGSGQQLLTSTYDISADPSWSPDGSKIAFTAGVNHDCEGSYTYSVNTISPDGTGNTVLVNPTWSEESQPAWSPDGQKIAFTSDRNNGDSDLWVMNTDGGAQTQIPNQTAQLERSADWQPIPHQATLAPSYDHPRLAGPIRFSIVPNFRQTISNSQCTARGGLNSTHGAPLAFSSCNPPGFVPGTIAHMGPASSSWASYAVIYGDTNSANGDQANVTLRASLNDIRTASGADYPAALTLVTKLRINDRFNGGSQTDPATAADFDYSTPISCASTAGPEGANCNLDTSMDAVTAGTIKENKATVIQVFRYRVNDSGANGTRGDADDRTFATQGIYIP
jgi:hypothetical protein